MSNMKKMFFAFAVGVLAMLTSCNKDEAGLINDNEQTNVTFNLKLPISTRIGGCTRFVIEVYEGNSASGTVLQHVEYGTTPKPIVLNKNKTYTFLFWADNGTPSTETTPSSGDYNVANLKNVSISALNHQPSYEAFCGSTSFIIESNDMASINYNITLKRAVAQVIYMQANEDFTTDNNSLEVTYPSDCKMDVSSGTLFEDDAPFTHKFTNIPKASANQIIGSSYIFSAMGVNQKLYTLQIKFNSESEKTINNVIIKQNSKTTVSGPYSNLYLSTFSISNTVNTWTDENTGINTEVV